MPGPLSKIERDGMVAAILADKRLGLTYRELEAKYGYPGNTIERVLAKLRGKPAETGGNPAPQPVVVTGAMEAVRLHRDLVEGELLSKYRTASREFEASLASGDAPGARAWLSRLTPILGTMARAVGLDQGGVNVAVGVQVKPQDMAQGLLEVARGILPSEWFQVLLRALEKPLEKQGGAP